MSDDPKVMGSLRITGLLRALGWLATLIMACVAAGVIASLLASACGACSTFLP
jgi:hypothetical protein